MFLYRTGINVSETRVSDTRRKRRFQGMVRASSNFGVRIGLYLDGEHPTGNSRGSSPLVLSNRDSAGRNSVLQSVLRY